MIVGLNFVYMVATPTRFLIEPDTADERDAWPVECIARVWIPQIADFTGLRDLRDVSSNRVTTTMRMQGHYQDACGRHVYKFRAFHPRGTSYQRPADVLKWPLLLTPDRSDQPFDERMRFVRSLTGRSLRCTVEFISGRTARKTGRGDRKFAQRRR
jgi:hypothetical protein